MTSPQDQLFLARLAAAWGVTAPSDVVALEALVVSAPETLRSIERLVAFLFDPADRPRWYLGIVWTGPTPADAFRRGREGAIEVESALCDVFRPNAPPEAFETDMVEPADAELCERIVLRMMLERAEAQGRRSWSFVDPLIGRPHPKPVEALAAAIWGCARRRDCPETRALMRAALGEQDHRIRMAGVRGAGRFLGYRDVRAAVDDLSTDPVAAVRLEIVRQLGKFSDISEIRLMLFGYVNDFSKKVRMEALSWLLARGLSEREARALTPLCFDPHKPLARLARKHIPAPVLEEEVDRRVLALRTHAEMTHADLALMVRCDRVPGALRAELFAERIGALAEAGRDGDLALTVRAIGYWDGRVPERLWNEILRLIGPERTVNVATERALLMCLGQKQAPWPVFRALLDHPEFGSSAALEDRLVDCAAEAAQKEHAASGDLAERAADETRALEQRRRALRVLARHPEGRARLIEIAGRLASDHPLRAEAEAYLTED